MKDYTFTARTGEAGLRAWFETPDAHSVLDDAVMGCLLRSEVIEICEDWNVTRATFRSLLDQALREGN